MDSEIPAGLLALHEQVAKCGKCGFCQPACPIYRTTYREGHVARGKHALMRNIIEGETVLQPDLRDAFDNCLLCRACTDSCFSDLRTDRLVVAFREAYAGRFGRSTLQRAIFRGLLPYPRRMKALVRVAWIARAAGLDGVAARLGLLDMVNPKLRKALELREGAPGMFLRERLSRPAANGKGWRRGRAATNREEVRGRRGATVLPPIPESRSGSGDGPGTGMRVGYWISCGYNYMLPEVGEATVDVLRRRTGASVEILENSCCGLPAYGYGDLAGARSLARRNIETLGDLSRFDAVVSECGSCSGHLKEYPELLAGDREFAPRSRRLAAKVRSFSEFLVEIGVSGSQTPRAAVPGPTDRAAGDAAQGGPVVRPLVVTFHEPCHLGGRFQGVVRQPRELLRALPGVEFRELRDADSCCGAAGSYNMVNPAVSGAILARKMENVAATGADVLVTECPSCMLQLSLGAKRAGSNVRVVGISELIAELQHPASR